MKNHYYGSLLALTCVFMLSCTPKSAYVANSNSGDVSGYKIHPNTGALTEIPDDPRTEIRDGSPFPAGGEPQSVAVDPSGTFAYVTNLSSGNVSGYRIDPTGALIPIGGSPFPAGSLPNCVEVDPSGRFAYVTNSGALIKDSNVSGYRIDPTTGALTPIAGSPFPTGRQPSSVVVAPVSGKFAYVTNFRDNSVSGYRIDPTGALTPIAGPPFDTGTGPDSVAVDRSGKFAYVANSERPNEGVSGYKINPTTGALTPIGSFAAGGRPNSVAVTPSPRFTISPWFSRFSHWFLFKLRLLTTRVAARRPQPPPPPIKEPR